ncbi:hypothetical protein GCM10010464_28830 [Pseudonocardia yunnanensis]|uniref:Uncharacterized protein n=1 Tax=Pseudonocardia yunnanensis TaxID=58107 RepID=A0ABW4EWR3_9PSEU
MFSWMRLRASFIGVLAIAAAWTEHLRQHLERGTAMDRDAEEGARRLIAPGTRTQKS